MDPTIELNLYHGFGRNSMVTIDLWSFMSIRGVLINVRRACHINSTNYNIMSIRVASTRSVELNA